MSGHNVIAETERIGGLILQVVDDPFADQCSPRDNDNLAVIYGETRNYDVGDGKPPADEMAALERGGIRLLARYVRMCKGAVAFTKVGMIDHSGISFYPVELGSKGESPFDPGGWDSGTVGYSYVSAESLASMGTPLDAAREVMLAELDEYDQWSRGNVWGYVVTKPCPDAHHAGDSLDTIADCPHSDVLDSCWGYIGDPKYALEDGRTAAESEAERA